MSAGQTVRRSTADRLSDALDTLLAEVAAKASLVPGDTGHPYNTGSEHRTWALWGRWRAGGESVQAAHAALCEAIRADLMSEDA